MIFRVSIEYEATDRNEAQEGCNEQQTSPKVIPLRLLDYEGVFEVLIAVLRRIEARTVVGRLLSIVLLILVLWLLWSVVLLLLGLVLLSRSALGRSVALLIALRWLLRRLIRILVVVLFVVIRRGLALLRHCECASRLYCADESMVGQTSAPEKM